MEENTLLALLQAVRASRAIAEKKITKGMRGTVVVLHEHPVLAYEVEFVEDQGRTLVQAVLSEEELEVLPMDP